MRLFFSVLVLTLALLSPGCTDEDQTPDGAADAGIALDGGDAQ